MVKLDFEGVDEFLRFSLGLHDILKDNKQAYKDMVKRAVLEEIDFRSNYLIFLDAARDNKVFKFSHETTFEYNSRLRGKVSATMLEEKVVDKDTHLLLDFNYRSMAMGFSVFVGNLYTCQWK
jgi:hypothetical protein